MGSDTQTGSIGSDEELTIEDFEDGEFEDGFVVYGDLDIFGEATFVNNPGFTLFDTGRNIERAEAEWDSGIAFTPASNTYKLVDALLESADQFDADLEDAYDAHHIDSVVGDELNRLAQLVDVDRITGETDDKFRARIKAAFRTGNIGTTYDQFVEFTASVLNASVDDLTFNTSPAVVTVTGDSNVYNNINITASELIDVLGGAVPAGHEVNVVEEGTFELKADGQTDDATKGLTADGITTGGTLSQDAA
jgi:hypothetical protein